MLLPSYSIYIYRYMFVSWSHSTFFHHKKKKETSYRWLLNRDTPHSNPKLIQSKRDLLYCHLPHAKLALKQTVSQLFTISSDIFYYVVPRDMKNFKNSDKTFFSHFLRWPVVSDLYTHIIFRRKENNSIIIIQKDIYNIQLRRWRRVSPI